MNKEQLKKEATEEFEQEFVLTLTGHNYIAGNITPDIMINFINSQIDKAYEAGKEFAIERIAEGEGWEESKEHYKKLLLTK